MRAGGPCVILAAALMALMALLALVAPSAGADEGRAPAAPTPTAAPPDDSPAAKRWRARMEAFRHENAGLDPAKRYAIFVGDSITERFPLATHFAGAAVLNRGIGGDTTGIAGPRGVVRRLEESVFACRPAVVFLQIGVNDLNGTATPPAAVVTGVAAIVDAVRARMPDLPVVLGTVLPAAASWRSHAELNPRIEAFNAGLRALAAERKLPLLDVHAAYRDADGLLPASVTKDGLHLATDAYGSWAELARPLLP